MANAFTTMLCKALPLLSICSSSTTSSSTTSSSATSSSGGTIGTVSSPTPPNDDPFYTPPSGYESATLGTILNSRTVPNPLSLNDITPINYKSAWQLLYRTQNSLGNPEATVVTVIEPYNAKTNHLFSLLYFVDSAYNDCNPSIAMQALNPISSSFTQIQVAEIVVALDQGWYVSVADDEGPQAAFGSGLQMGYATLDSIRAALQSESITGLQPDAITTMTG